MYVLQQPIVFYSSLLYPTTAYWTCLFYFYSRLCCLDASYSSLSCHSMRLGLIHGSLCCHLDMHIVQQPYCCPSESGTDLRDPDLVPYQGVTDPQHCIRPFNPCFLVLFCITMREVILTLSLTNAASLVSGFLADFSQTAWDFCGFFQFFSSFVNLDVRQLYRE